MRPTHEQGITVLGTPLGHDDFIRAHLEQIAQEHAVLLERIPSVPDTQSAWALLLHCANARANYCLRVVRPDVAEDFAHAHNAGLWQCLSDILRVSPDLCDRLSRDSSSFATEHGRGWDCGTQREPVCLHSGQAGPILCRWSTNDTLSLLSGLSKHWREGATLPRCVLWLKQRGPWTEWRVLNLPVGGLSADVHALQTIMQWRWSLAQCGEAGNMRQLLGLNAATVERQSCLFWTLRGKLS